MLRGSSFRGSFQMLETDYEAIKRRFAEERNLRLAYRPEGTAQFTSELSGDLAKFAIDPYVEDDVMRACDHPGQSSAPKPCPGDSRSWK